MVRGSESVHQRIETPERSQPKPEWDSELDQRVDRWRHVAALRKDHVPGHASVIIKPELGALAQESKADPIEIAQPAGPHSLVGHEVPPHRVVHIRLHEDLDNRVVVLWMLARRVQSRRDGVALDEGCSSRPRTRRLHRSSRRRSLLEEVRNRPLREFGRSVSHPSVISRARPALPPLPALRPAPPLPV